MKFFVSVFVIAVIVLFVYFRLSKSVKKSKKTKIIHKKAIIVSGVLALFLVALLTLAMYLSATAPDKQCTTAHETTTMAPASLKTANDYFLLGNYDYDTGDCVKATIDYKKSIQLDPKVSQTYNNLAYTLMRMQDYNDALPYLDQAISLNPNYIQALMNRGDIHNYYYGIDKKAAIADYQKVITLGGTKETSVCGHLFLAEHNGWNLGTILELPFVNLGCK